MNQNAVVYSALLLHPLVNRYRIALKNQIDWSIYCLNLSLHTVSNVSIKAADAPKGSQKCQQDSVFCGPMGRSYYFSNSRVDEI